MIRRIKWILMLWLLPCLLVLSGCWDMRNIQDVNYAVAVGWDYHHGQYTMYFQMLDHSDVAKSEMGKPMQPIPVWVGKASGPTPDTAANHLYQSAQQQVTFSQVNAFVFTQATLKHGLDRLVQALNHYREVRYTPWIFATNDNLEDVFRKTPFFYMSPLNSVLHAPQEVYKQESLLEPLTYQDFLASYREPGRTTLLPSLTTTRAYWKAGKQKKDLLMINGAYAIYNEKFIKWFSENDLTGTRWMNDHTVRTPLLIRSQGKPKATVSLEEPDVKVTPDVKNGKPIFNVHIDLRGNIEESLGRVSEDFVKKRAEQLVKKQIRHTFLTGLKNHADLLQLESYLYRYDNQQWKQLKPKGFHLTKNTLKKITVDIDMIHTGRAKQLP